MTQPKNRVWLHVIVASISLAAVLLFISAALLINYGRQPFRMVIEPTETGSEVYFLDPNRGMTTQRFTTSPPVTQRIEIDLSDTNEQIPNGTLEFIDTSYLPGRATLQYGDTHFDIMSSRYSVNGRDFQWQPQLDENTTPD